jgi:hypothetical protein
MGRGECLQFECGSCRRDDARARGDEAIMHHDCGQRSILSLPSSEVLPVISSVVVDSLTASIYDHLSWSREGTQVTVCL